MLDDNTKDFFFEGFAWKYNEVPRGEKNFWGICMKIELSSEEKKGLCSCHPTWPLWHQMQDTVFVRVILLILITIVPNKIFSYGLKQTMLETKHIWMKTVYKSKKKYAFPVFISLILWNMCKNHHYESVYFCIIPAKDMAGTADQKSPWSYEIYRK